MRRSSLAPIVIGVIVAVMLLLPALAFAAPTKGCGPTGRTAWAGLEKQLDDGSYLFVNVWTSDYPAHFPINTLEITYYVLRPVGGDEWEYVAQGFGAVDLAGRAFRASGGSLTKASLSATVPMAWADDTAWGDATVKLAWTGTGAATIEKDHEKTISEETGLTVIMNNIQRWRDARVSGTLVLPDGSAWTGDDLTGGLTQGHTVNVYLNH